MDNSEKLSIVFESQKSTMTRAEHDEGYTVIKDLQIERAFRTICPEAMYRDPFISILCRPLPTLDEVMKRQAVIKAFLTHNDFLDRLIAVFRQFMSRKSMWDKDRSRLLAVRKAGNAIHGFVDSGELITRINGEKQLVVNDAHYIRSVSALLNEAMAVIAEYKAVDGYLGRLYDACQRIVQYTEHAECGEFLSKCDLSLTNAYSYTFDFTMNDKLEISDMIMSDFEFIRKAAPKQNFWSRFSKKNDDENAVTDNRGFSAECFIDGGSAEYGYELILRAVAE